MRRSKIFISGKMNKVMVKGGLINSSISVSGEFNKVYIADSTRIHNVNIVVRGVGCNCYIGYSTTFGGARLICMGENNSVVIGEKCMFSDNIEIWATDSHPIYDKNGDIINISKPIIFGNNIWVGAHAIILKGVSVGNGAIIGMGSMVTKNIEPSTINVGCPSRCVKTGVNYWKREYITI